MVTKQDVVSPERYGSALSYQQFLAQATQNLDEFADNYGNTKVSDALKQRLQALVAKPNGPKKLLVLGEDWCPDVYRGMPVLARLAEAAGMEFKALPRDQNIDVMNAYLNKGEFQSIPCGLFLTDKLELVLVWHERPQQATEEMPNYVKLREGRDREVAAPDLKKFRQGSMWAGWRDATVEELTRLLEKATA